MKTFQKITLLSLLSFSSFAAGECANDSAFKKLCSHVDSTLSAIQCVIANNIQGTCGDKITQLGLSCSKSVIQSCETSQGSDNAYESCISKSSETECAEWGNKYK